MFSLSQYPDLPKNYSLQALLGEGAFSSVYKATNLSTGEEVAIKIINKTNLSHKQLANINNEIYVMNTLANSGNHRNVLRLIESFDTKENCFLVLEYCDGGEIFNKIIEYTYFSENLARHVFLQLLDAISFMHHNNVVHRDIKPENLLFKTIPFADRSEEEFIASLRASDDRSKVDEGRFIPGIGGGGIGIIKLADFGLAKQLRFDPAAASGRSSSNLKTPCGTAGYTAPEVIHCGVERKRRFRSSTSKNNFYSKAVDIWSLGCFLYTALCGFPPFYDDDNEVLTHKILTGDYVFLEPWWDEISHDAKDLINKMLVVNTKERITLEEIYKHPWLASATPLQTESYFPERATAASPHRRSPASSLGSSKRSVTPVALAGGLASPRIAIKQVFNNPAMSHVNLKSLANLERNRAVDPKAVKFDVASSLKSGDKNPKNLGLSPLYDVNFKDVFNRADPSYDSDDFDDELNSSDVDVTEDSDLDSGAFTAGFQTDEDLAELVKMKNLSISSTSSTDSSRSNEDEYVTQSSSVISGVNGDFKFTLNLNDSNLLRRRSSVKSGTNA